MTKCIVFILIALCLAGCEKPKKSTAAQEIMVRTMIPAQREFSVIVPTQGVVEAVDHATLSARIAGCIEELKVKVGSQVKSGEALFRQDRATLENRRALAQETLNMALERLNTRTIDARIAKLNLAKAKLDYDRNHKLFLQKIVSPSSMESIELKYDSAKLAEDKAGAALQTSEAEVKFARAALKISEKNLEDSIVRAPYDGVITAKLKEEHEFCAPGTAVLKIERPAKRRVKAALSGLHFNSIVPGRSKVILHFGGRSFPAVPVTEKDNTIDPVSRTFEVRAELPAELAPASGALCDTFFILDRRRSFALPEEAILYRQNGKFAVFENRNGKAHEIAVRPGITWQGYTEILDPETVKGKKIVVSGHYFLNDGTLVLEQAK